MDDIKSEIDPEKSVSKSDTDVTKEEPALEKPTETVTAKNAEGSEYESAEEDGEEIPTKKGEESSLKDQESLAELVDEEGGEEGIAEPEEVEGDFLNGEHPDECDGELEKGVEICDENKDDVDVADEADTGEGDKADAGDGDEAGAAKGDEVDERGNEADEGGDEADEGEDEADEGGNEADEEGGDEEEIDEGSDEEYGDERHPEEDGSDEGEYVEEERQQGDGEECSPENAAVEKELDFDEDRRNPQYIPKKGIFYEHDDRNNEDVKEKEEEPLRDRKKKLWLDEGRWGHDRFRLEEQHPKSKHELIETYGYDIRNEDGPPRARRRRRYGRGPTKYERNWEDVTAYGREKFRGRGGFSRGQRGDGPFRGGPRFRGRGRKEFASGDPDNDYDDEKNIDEETIENGNKGDDLDENLPVINNKEFPALPSKDSVIQTEVTVEKRPFFQKSSSEAPENKSVRTLTFENSNLGGRNSLERDVPTVKSKPVVYNRQNERNISHSDKNVNLQERAASEYERNMNHYDRKINQSERNERYFEKNQSERNDRYEKNFNQSERNDRYEKNFSQSERNDRYEKNFNQSERNDRYEKNFNQSERNDRYEKNFNQSERNDRYEKNFNQSERNDRYEKSISYHEKSLNHHDKNVGYHDRNLSYHDKTSGLHERNMSHHERGTRKPIFRGNRGSSRGDRRGRGGGMRHISPRFLENKISTLNTDMGHLNIEDAADICNNVNTEKVRQVDTDIVQRITSESEITNMSVKGSGDLSSRPKRYSSLRQRSLPETTTYQASQTAVPTQPSPFYEGAGYQPALYAPTNTGVPTPSTQSQSATSPPLMNPSGFHPYDCGIRLQLLPRAIFPQPAIPAGQSVLAPPPPSPCIPQPTPNLIDFTAAPPPPSGYHQYAYQQYAQPPPVHSTQVPPPTAPNEIYQPGITYYFAQQTQSTSARPTVQKRPKAAIPILPPPERESKKNEIKEVSHVNSNSSRNNSIEGVNGEVLSLRTDPSSQSQQLPSVGVES